MCVKLHVYTVNKICQPIVDQLIESKYTGVSGKVRIHYITAFKTASNSYIFLLFMLS